MFERQELETLLALAEELHFGRTAARLNVSTARVSQTIRGLERRVGAPLFDRTSRRVAPTEIGRRLAEEIAPAWAQIIAAGERAVDAGRGFTGTLRAAFVDPAGGQLLAGAGELFRGRHPECGLELREAPVTAAAGRVREGTVDLALVPFPVAVPELARGPVLVREARVLAVRHDHPFARRDSVAMADLSRVRLIELAGAGPAGPARDHRTAGGPPAWPDAGPAAAVATVDEALTLAGAGQGAFVTGAHARRYHPRPDVAYVPIRDAPPLEWGLVWPAAGGTARVLAFARAATDLLAPGRSAAGVSVTGAAPAGPGPRPADPG
ncbi:LysR family transcriptional regulator [Sphaerisporangium rufum]|uniref:LysR family transcriptional regulator n=1 Tax=Sphaerisporangium rufum TaxID=1381558 RepID=A0A919UYT9_9ACTN|nr:LysR family transcriptional regulator [Sphaerisporangium rufum]GII75492.1 LysR family transcriptional regulator [Sphaerisporangium rufum]